MLIRGLILAVVAVLLSGGGWVAAEAQTATSPRFRDGALPMPSPEAFGGGEVVLELTIGPNGGVNQIQPIRATPPFAETMVEAVTRWRFAPGTTIVNGRLTPEAAPVLVVGLFRAPTLYAAPAPGALPSTVGVLSPRLPQPTSLVMPSYPPNARGDAMVIVEVEMTRLGAARGYRVVSPQSGFDRAALDAVRAWRFTPPRAAELPENLFVYAVIGFRTPVTE